MCDEVGSMEDLLTTDQAAKILKLHVKRVQALARAGRLPATRVGRKWLFPRSRLEARLGRRDQPGPHVEISGRNQLRGTVTEVRLGDVMAEVRVLVADQDVVSIITRSSAERLRLKAGDPALVIIKATDVMIGRP
jgi:molybdopterin-binding protein